MPGKARKEQKKPKGTAEGKGSEKKKRARREMKPAKGKEETASSRWNRNLL
jgi:hypothetical protein